MELSLSRKWERNKKARGIQQHPIFYAQMCIRDRCKVSQYQPCKSRLREDRISNMSNNPAFFCSYIPTLISRTEIGWLVLQTYAFKSCKVCIKTNLNVSKLTNTSIFRLTLNTILCTRDWYCDWVLTVHVLNELSGTVEWGTNCVLWPLHIRPPLWILRFVSPSINLTANRQTTCRYISCDLILMCSGGNNRTCVSSHVWRH